MAHVHTTKSTTKILAVDAAGDELFQKITGGTFLRVACWLRDKPTCEACREQGKPCTMKKPCKQGSSATDKKNFLYWTKRLHIGVSPINEEELIFQLFGDVDSLIRLETFPFVRKMEMILSNVAIPVFAAGSMGKD